LRGRSRRRSWLRHLSLRQGVAQAPEEPQRRGVVVVRHAQVQVAQQVLVHEVEPEPAAHVAVGRQRHLPVTVDEVEGNRVALRGVGEAGEDVPRRGDDEEDCQRRPRMQRAQAGDRAARAASDQQVEQHDADREDDSDQSLGQHVQRAGQREAEAPGADAIGSGRMVDGSIKLFGAPEAEHRKGDPEADARVGNGDAGEDEEAEAGEQDERGVEARAWRPEETANEGFYQQREREHGQSEWNTGSGGERARGGDAEELRCPHARGHRPVEQRGLLQVADAVGVEGDEVVTDQHLAGDLDVD
jgi:hypothetical protein